MLSFAFFKNIEQVQYLKFTPFYKFLLQKL